MFEDEKELPEQLAKSKSQLKREASALQSLGERLVTLSADQLAYLHLPEPLLQAVQEAKAISSHGAKRRQRQYIGRLMRDIEDPSFIVHFFHQLDKKRRHK